MKSNIRDLPALVFQAYVNEVCLDRSLKLKFLSSEPMADNLPQYKIMPLLSLYKRHGKMFLWFLRVLRFAIPPFLLLAALSNILLALVFAVPFFRRFVSSLPENICLPNTKNHKLFYYLFDDFDKHVRFECRRPWAVLRYLGFRDYVCALLIVLKVIWLIFRCPQQNGVRRQDMIFHALDLLPFVWFSLFAFKLACCDKKLITDCNLQRWGYVASHFSKNCSVIQHAYIHEDLKFCYSFGAVDCLYLFDVSFKRTFSMYYEVDKIDFIKPKINFDDMGSTKNVLFLASSAPFLDAEVEFLEHVKLNCDFFIVVKLHPKHVYERSVVRLTSLADRIVTSSVFPDCCYQVSYDSFLGYEYKALGKNVLFLKDEVSVQNFFERYNNFGNNS